MSRFAHLDPTTPTSPPFLEDAQIHVWAFMLDEPPVIVTAWRQLLSSDEALRADRFVFNRDRDRWIVARGALRQLLGQYCRKDPRTIAFNVGSWGKPEIAQRDATEPPIAFNLAHSHDRAVLAVTREGEVGVDIEFVRDDFDPLPIAREFFFGAELAAIHAVASEQRREAFFRYWVAKEAVLKAHGTGLSLALDSFSVTFEADALSARVHAHDAAAPVQSLVVRMLPLPRGWHGAVAAHGDAWTLRTVA